MDPYSDILASMNNLGEAYREAGRLDRALPLMEETLAFSKARRGPDHPETLTVLNNLALGYRDAGQLDRALPLYEETLALSRAKLGADPDTLTAMNNLAGAYRAAGQPDRALPLYEEPLALRKARLGPDHPDTLISMDNLAKAYFQAKRPGDALRAVGPFLQGQRKRPGADALEFAGLLAVVGFDALIAEQFAAAEPMLRECLAIRETAEPDDWKTYNTKSMLGAALLGQKKHAEAEPLLRAGYEGVKERADKIPPFVMVLRLGESLDRLIELAEATGKADEAKAWRDERARLADAASSKPDAGK